jgi:DNA helicase II / ATP-dependent DNA helicase PcrA
MVVIARTVGGPGAGKTYRALSILEMVLDRSVRDPMRIGFVSFTRSARREAAARAADKFNISRVALERDGWFRTLHSVCYRQLGISNGELLTGTAEDNAWLKNVLDDEQVRVAKRDDDDDYLAFSTDLSDAGRALALWDHARSRQVPLEDPWEAADAVDCRTLDLSVVEGVVSLYEAAKARDGRLDFCDLLMRFAGRKWTGDHSAPFRDCLPQGNVPVLPVWVHDEMQDCSELTAMVFRRLIEPSQWVYLFGDRLQEIYSWAGADGAIFGDWPVAKEEELPVSYRCGQKILDYGFSLLGEQGFKGKRDQFKGAEGGEVRCEDVGAALGSIRPGEDVLVLARTNAFAAEAAKVLDDCCCPWKPTKGGGGWNAPARAAGVSALVTLQKGGKVDGEAFRRLLELLPSKHAGVDLFERGTKAWFDDESFRQNVMPFTLKKSDAVGSTWNFQELVGSGKWKELLEPAAQKMANAAEAHGVEVLKEPTVRVGTCHSSKGMQADHVVVIDRVPYPTTLAVQEPEGEDAERRLWYVTATRARKQLTVAQTDLSYPSNIL